MMRAASAAFVLLAAAMLASPPARAIGDLDDPGPATDGQPGSSWATFDFSYLRVGRYFDGNGSVHSLNEAYASFGENARGVSFDALVVSFSGRYVLGPGFTTGVRVPFVRNSRSGHVPLGAGQEQSFYAEGSALGDLVADIALDVPFPDTPSSFGASLALQLPSGRFSGLDNNELPTGTGSVGVGGELYAIWRGGTIEAGGAAGILVLLPHHATPEDVDPGDPLWGRVFAGVRVRNARLGLEVAGMSRSADRQGSAPPATVVGGGVPGALAPASSLVTVAPYLDASVGRGTFVRVSLSNPGSGWLFAPVDTGIAVHGKNVLAPDAQARVSLIARF